MKRFLVLIPFIAPVLLFSQSKTDTKQYPSLLWEITGKGLKKPSYLFGTMHVSNKLAFQLSDSFYLGIRNADVVALETNPESWQEDMSKYGTGNDEGYSKFNSGFVAVPNDYLTENTLKFYKYDSKIERSLYSNPSTINNLLYRNYDRGNSDFEEDTYLDMYIYQCGKRWGKKVAGVERYGESMKLMAEAYKDAAKDRNKKTRSYYPGDGYSLDKLQEAYRTGNLDLLDSINKYNSFSEAFDEKFLYKRNEIQAESIDSILKSKASLFVGVGAAHLPGERGVIEMLREMGYRLRPIKMRQRDSQHKNTIEKLRVPVKFNTHYAEDSLFQIDIPGKFYKFGEDGSLDQRQYADMANGSYYMVTRIMTNAWMWGHKESDVYRTVDSLLYENIPGKIITKTTIQKNGYKGFAITNRTRRGDIQRYNIFITPFEVIFFKMSGTGEYVTSGDEAEKFFNSIKFRSYKTDAVPPSKKFSPSFGGFAISFPHEPYVGNDGSWIYDAEDKNSGEYYRVIRSDIHNYEFSGVDTFDLKLMEESFASSEFIKKMISRRQTKYKGYPALECRYSDSYGNLYLVRFVIRGANYYTIMSRAKKESEKMKQFLDSFDFVPINYGVASERIDTSLYYSVRTPYFQENADKLDVPVFEFSNDDEDVESEAEQIKSGIFRSKVIENDTTGEKLFVLLFSTRRYYQALDSSWEKKVAEVENHDSTSITRFSKITELPNRYKVWERLVSDSQSSRAQWSKTFYRDGIGYRLMTQVDTLSKPSTFIQSFFDNFTPADTLTGNNPYSSKTKLFLADFMSSDSLKHNRAVKRMDEVKFDSANLDDLKQAISSLNWKRKNYLDTKKGIIFKLHELTSRNASNYLKDQYYAAEDTIELQYMILGTLLRQKTSYAFNVFRDILLNEPPVLGLSDESKYSGINYVDMNVYEPSLYLNNGVAFMANLYDSLALTKSILPEILPLLNLDDYERPLMNLLGTMVDSNLIKYSDYQVYFHKFLIEAKQELKKQRITEKNREIAEAEKAKDAEANAYDRNDRDPGNSTLSLYATLLLPFSKTEGAVDPLLHQILQSKDRELKFRTAILCIRNGKQLHDSILQSFAADDNYRYELYKSLKKIDQLSRFPEKYLSQSQIARSKLLSYRGYSIPDSLVRISKLPLTIGRTTGVIYFFKYKAKKDDISWRIAACGMMPSDSTLIEFREHEIPNNIRALNDHNRSGESGIDLTTISEVKLNSNESIEEQLAKVLKKLVYSQNKSGKEFYENEFDN